MRVIFIGSVYFSYSMLKHLLTINIAEVVGIVTKKQSSFNADFCSLKPLADTYEIPYVYAEDLSQEELVSWMKNLYPDVIYCFGWSQLLKNEIITVPSLGAIGYHPAALPRNRGRHPIIWALALGLEETASTFFFMDEGADTGDIVSQEFITIEFDDDASTLYEKLISTAKRQLEALTVQLATRTYSRIPQIDSEANYWRKRSMDDGLIDWRMTATSIYNLVRALTKPYVGAHCLVNGNEKKVWKAKVALSQDNEENRHIEPGKVLKVSDGQIWVKCGEGVVILVEHDIGDELEEGMYL